MRREEKAGTTMRTIVVRRLRGVGRLLLKLLLLLTILAGIGASYQEIGTIVDEHLDHPAGVLLDVGGYRLHLYCTGHGHPTVILDAGLGSNSSAWRLVQPAVSRTTRVCSYDRAGAGWSNDGPLPRTSARIVTELRRLLRSGGVEPPYVLVGHSFGGFDVRLYASENRSQVSGMVLVDASSETMYNGGAGDGGKILLEPCRVATRLGVFSVLAQLRVIPTPVTGSFYRPGWCTSLLGELASIDVSAREVRLHRHFLGRLPLVVLTRDIHQRRTGDTRQTLRRWWHLQTGLARLSSQSLHVMVKHSGHAIPTERPGYVIWAIQRVVREARANAGRR